MGILKASTRHSALICYALASGAPSLYLSLAMASQGVVAMGVVGPRFDQLVDRTAQAMLGLGSFKGASCGAQRFLKSLTLALLLSTVIGGAILSESGLGWLPGDEVERKRAKEFACDTVLHCLIGSGFLLKQATQLGESVGLTPEKAALAGHFFYAAALLLAFYTIANGDRDSSLRLFEHAKEEVVKSLDEIEKGIAGLETALVYRASIQQLRIALQKGLDEFLDALPDALTKVDISLSDLEKELINMRHHAGFYAACLTTGIEQVRAPTVGATQV